MGPGAAGFFPVRGVARTVQDVQFPLSASEPSCANTVAMGVARGGFQYVAYFHTVFFCASYQKSRTQLGIVFFLFSDQGSEYFTDGLTFTEGQAFLLFRS